MVIIHLCFVINVLKGYEIYHYAGTPSKNGKFLGDFTPLANVSASTLSYHVQHPKYGFDHTYKVRVADALGYPGAFASCGTKYAPPPGMESKMRVTLLINNRNDIFIARIQG